MSVMNVQGTGLRAHAQLVVQCYASGEVRCGIVLSVVISICVIELSVPVLLSTLSS